MKPKTPEQLARLSDDALLAYLESLAGEIARVKAEQEQLWSARIAVYQEGRRRDPAITLARLAEAAGVSEVAIITKLSQLDKRAQEATATT